MGDRTRFVALLERIQNASRLSGGETGSGPGWSRLGSEYSDPLRVVVAFPEAYEIGISNQAIQILYHLARETAGVGVERCYLPWVEAISLMRAEGLYLPTLETWSPVRDAHLVGITLQHELNYTNVLELLHLAEIPVRASQRPAFPLVIAGGPAVSNFLPMEPFLDAVVVGDGEEVFPEILELMRREVESGAGRTAVLSSLASIRGVYVPGVSRSVERRVLASLEGAPYPVECLVPLAAGVHDRAWVEIMRGCTRGCRFCQAGMWYRPVRERRADSLLGLASAQLAASGHEELALSSLSTTDYSALQRVLSSLASDHPGVRVALPSLRVDSASVRLSHLVSPSSSTVTLAPEAGSQRLRDIINKNVSDEDIMGAAREAFAGGHTILKLYFMIGLPRERDEDVVAVVDLCRRLRELGKRSLGARSGRLALHVSVTNFIPKPFTPFQWEAMADRATLERRQGILRAGLGRGQAKLSLHSIDTSYLEAALARGGVELADVVEAAWEAGARFDCWTEHERLDAWDAAFRARGLSAEGLATTALDPAVALPWEVITGPVVSRSYLLRERERAAHGLTTPDCRWEGCEECGVCGEAVPGPDLAPADMRPDGDVVLGAGGVSEAGAVLGAGGGPTEGTMSRRPAASSKWAGRVLEYLIEYSVHGRQRFLAHLDTLQLLRRAVRRAGGTLALSAGMRPKPLLSVALPRPVGVESRQEFCQIALSQPPPADFVSRLAAALPEGVAVTGMMPWRKRKSVAAYVVGCRYMLHTQPSTGRAAEGVEAVQTHGGERWGDMLAAAARRYTEAGSILVERRRPGEIRRVDVKLFVSQVQVREDGGVEFHSLVGPGGSARPQEIAAALAQMAGEKIEVRSVERLAIDLGGDGLHG